MKRIIFATLLLAPFALLSGQTTAETPDIVSRLNASQSVRVSQPEALGRRLMPQVPAAVQPADEQSAEEPAEVLSAGETGIRQSGVAQQRRVAGYRVQIFSDNNVRTAKAEARRKARAIADAFPQYPTYVVFTSPYWRLKVGDFKSQDAAEVAATEIKRAFPAYAREIRVVRDRINVK